MINRHQNPSWWNEETDSAWGRVKAAFKRDWDQTKHDMGGKEPDTDQDVDDTLAQAAGKQAIPPRGEPTYETVEPAYRFGYGAHTHYGKLYGEWNDDLENKLKSDWKHSNPDRNWDDEAEYVRAGWDYKE